MPRKTTSLQIFKGCLPQILLILFLKALTQMGLRTGKETLRIYDSVIYEKYESKETTMLRSKTETFL